MHRATWKRWERAWAAWFGEGAARVPSSGARQRGDAPDVSHPRFAIEIKCGERLLSARLKLGMAQAVACAGKTGGMPLLCVSQRDAGKRDMEHYIILRRDDFARLAGIAAEPPETH